MCSRWNSYSQSVQQENVHDSQNMTESLEYVISEAVDTDSFTKTLDSPIVINIIKTPVYVRYPLTYVRSFNNKPFEQIMQIGPGFSGFFDPCEDRAGAGSSSTCPPAYDTNSDQVVDSQGFCCYCSLAQQLGLDKFSGTRGQLSCQVFGSQTASASCLSMDTLWYNGYSMGQVSTYFAIDIKITKNHGLPSETSETISVGTESTITTSSTGEIIVSLQGDFAGYTDNWQLSSKTLLVPNTPGNPRTYEGVEKYLLVDNSLITLDGTECNKIGVSYSAFKNQVNPCTRKAGTCLGNQPEELYMSDLAKKKLGLAGKYFTSNFGKLDILDFSDRLSGEINSNKHYLAFVKTESTRSLITLTLKADSINFIVNRAGGQLIYVNLPTFEAQSNNGNLAIGVKSTGLLNSDFTLSTTKCTFGIAPIQSKTFTLLPEQTLEVTFQIKSELIITAYHNCLITLKDSQGLILQTYTVFFNVTKLVEDKGTQGGNKNPGGYSVIVPYNFDCSARCSGFFSFSCFLTNSCWINILQILGVIIGACIFLCCFKNIKRVVSACCPNLSTILDTIRNNEELSNNQEIKEEKKSSRKRASNGNKISKKKLKKKLKKQDQGGIELSSIQVIKD